MNGPELRAIREEMSLTQVQFAELLGVLPQSVSDLERGKMNISNTLKNLVLTRKVLWEVKKLLDSA